MAVQDAGAEPASEVDDGTQEPEASEGPGGAAGEGAVQVGDGAAAEGASSPWAQDLTQRFEDEVQRAAVDEFLRETVQPYVTKLEQESTGNRSANKLYEDLTKAPVETYVSITGELFGDEVAEAVTAVLRGEAVQAGDDDDEGTEVVEGQGEFDFDTDGLPPEVREAVEFVQDQKRTSAYQAEMDRVKEENPDIEFRPDVFNPFVAAADGDFDLAVSGYKKFLDDFKESHGLNVPNPDDVGEAEEPPPAIAAGAGGTSPPPVQKRYESLDEALDDFFDEQSNAPPTIGSG